MRAVGGMDAHALSGSFRTTGCFRRISLAILALTIFFSSRSLLAEVDSDMTSLDNEKGQRHVESCCPQKCLLCPSDVHPWHPDSLSETDEPPADQPLLDPSAPRTVTPNMIGDFFGSGGSTITLAFPRLVRQFRFRTVFPASGAGPLNPILTGSFNPVLFTPFGPPPVESAMTQMDIDQILTDPTLPESFVLLPNTSIASAAAIALGADEVVFVSSKADRVAFGSHPASSPSDPINFSDLFLLYTVFDIVTVVD